MSRNIAELETLAHTYSKIDYVCPISKDHSFVCGSVLSGALTKELAILGLTPYPEKPFNGISLETLRAKIDSIRKVSWRAVLPAAQASKRPAASSDPTHPCNLKNQVSISLAKHKMSPGLTLWECGI